MLSAHCIDELQFDVDFASAEQALDTQERVAAFARSRVPRIVEEVFDQFSRAGQVWRLPVLDLDLGQVAHDELEQQWETRLRERLAELLQLERALADGVAVRDRPVEPVGGAHPRRLESGVRSREEAQLDTLVHFLRFGHLPWHAAHGLALASPLGQLAHEVLRDSAQALVRAWRACPDAPTMVMRAARQFPSAWLARLAGELARELGVGAAASWGREAQAWVDGFLALWSESTLASTPPVHLLWQGLLAALWSEAGDVDRSQPLHSMVLALAPEEVRQAEVWRALQSVARRALDGTPPAPTATLSDALLRTCLAARVPSRVHLETDDASPGPNTGSRAETLARLMQRLQSWLPPNAQVEDHAPWLELLRAEASWARQALLQLTRNASARRRMAQALPPSILMSLMSLWLGPTEQDLLRSATEDTSLWGPASAPVDAATRWAFALDSVLLHPAPALFSGHAFVDELLWRRSERENRAPSALLHELEQRWHAGAPPALQAWLRTHLHEDAQDIDPRLQRRARLVLALSEGRLAGAEEEWSEAVVHDGAWLQDLLRRHARRPELLRRIAREWRSSTRTELIGLWLPAPERALVLAAQQDPVFASLAPAGERQPWRFLWEDLIAHLTRLTPGSFFHADAYLRALRERALQAADEERAADHAPSPDTPQARDELEAGVQTAVLLQLSPAEQLLIQQDLRLLQSAARRVGLPARHAALAQLAWQYARRELVEQRRRYEPVRFAARLARHLVEALRLPAPEAWLERLAADIGAQVHPDTAPRIAAAIRATAEDPLPLQPRRPARPIAPAEPGIDELLQTQPLHVAHAGIVLVGAYLPQLFGMLHLTKDEAFVSSEAAERAVLLLHHLVSGGSEAPEPQLALHKLLCGVPLEMPMLREFAIERAETEAIEGLLRAVIAHWKIIGHTSVAGLREAFLQREGRLHLDAEERWQLQVEERSFDMLLDQLPWGYGLHKFPWMKRPLHVAWR